MDLDYFNLLQRFVKAYNLNLSYGKCQVSLGKDVIDYWLKIVDNKDNSIFDIRKNNSIKEYICSTYFIYEENIDKIAQQMIFLSLGNIWECMDNKDFKIHWPKSIEELELKLSVYGV